MIEDVYAVLERIHEIRSRFGLEKSQNSSSAATLGESSFENTLSNTIKTEGAVAADQSPAKQNYRTNMSQADIDLLADKIAAREGISPSLVKSIIKNESSYDVDAVSPKGAMGLMQLMPSTVEELGVADPFSAEENIDGGVRMLKKLINTYQGDYKRAIAAYNAGKAAVDRAGGEAPFAETRSYVNRVLEGSALDSLKNLSSIGNIGDAANDQVNE